MILTKQSLKLHVYDSTSFVTQKQIARLLDKAPDYREELLEIFKIDNNNIKVLKIGNAKNLIDSINTLDSQCEKIDIISKVKDIQLLKMLEAEKALFEIFSIKNEFVLKEERRDVLVAETAYSAKSDILDYYNFNKFANYCRDKSYEDLVDVIKQYLKDRNANNEEEKKLRIIYKNEDKKFYLRAFTSSNDYKNFGINFSVFVALMALGKYAEENDSEIYIDNYVIDDSNLYVSFSLTNNRIINNNISLSLSLVLENDEVKRNAVSFNGLVRLNYNENGNKSEIYLKPKGIKKENNSFPVDLLNYPHRGTVKSVFEKIGELPSLIDFFIKQVGDDAEKISSIEHPNDVKKFIAQKILYSRKEEFKIYKDRVFNKLMSISVDNTFKLFELLREVEELFEHDDVVSLNFWRNKLYESLVEKR